MKAFKDSCWDRLRKVNQEKNIKKARDRLEKKEKADKDREVANAATAARKAEKDDTMALADLTGK